MAHIGVFDSGVGGLSVLREIVKLLPEGDFIYDENVVSNRSERFMIAEIMREKMLLKYDKEIPHGVAIIINVFNKQPNGV